MLVIVVLFVVMLVIVVLAVVVLVIVVLVISHGIATNVPTTLARTGYVPEMKNLGRYDQHEVQAPLCYCCTSRGVKCSSILPVYYCSTVPCSLLIARRAAPDLGNRSLRHHLLLRRTIVNKTYGTYKNLHVSLFLQTIFGPIYCVPQY